MAWRAWLKIGFVEERVFADDVHRLQFAPSGGLDHRRHGQTGGAVGHLTPGRAELRAVGSGERLIAGQVVGNAARVATALDVVLAAQR